MLCRARLAIFGRLSLNSARQVHQLLSPSCDARVFAADAPAVPSLAPAQAEVGDLVEFRDGKCRELGIVTFSPAGGSFDCATKDGATRTVYMDDVTLSLRPESGQTGAIPLENLQQAAEANAAKLAPFLDAAHAYLCLPEKANAVDLCELTKLVYAARSSSDRFFNSKYRQNSVTAQQILATYFAASRSEKFVRIGRAPFMAVSEHNMEHINRVMFGLANDDMHRAGTEIALYETDSKLGLLASTVVSMLRYFSVTEIAILAPLVRTIKRVLDERKQRQAAVCDDDRHQQHGLKLEALEIAQGILPVENPFLTRGLLAWPSGDNELDDSIDLRTSDFATPNPDVELPIETRPVVAVNDDLALGLDPDSVAERWVVSVYLPLVPALSHRSNAAVRAKSMCVGNRRLHFTPLSLRAQHSLRPDVARPCLRVSSIVRPWDAKYDLSQIQTTIVKARATNEGVTGSVGSGASWRFAKLERCLNIWAGQRQGDMHCEFDRAYIAKPGVDRSLATEARLLAGEWLGAWAAFNEVSVPFLCKPSANTKEYLAAELERHVGIGSKIYTPVAYPFESAVASHALRNIVRSLPGGQQLFPGLLDLGPLPAPNVVAASEAVDVVSSAARRYADLAAVKAGSRQVFPCELIQAAKPGERAAAWCPVLGLEVQVLASSTGLHAGDRVLCTEITELDPIEGALVFVA